MVKIYVDTNVYLDYLLDRKNLLGRPLGNDAFLVFARVVDGRFQLVRSRFVEEELYRQIGTEETQMLFGMMETNTVTVTYSNEEKIRAKEMNPAHWQDALHAIIANREKAEYLVTQNVSDYWQYSSLVTPVRPREI